MNYSGSFPKGGTGYKSATLTLGGVARSVSLYLPAKPGAKPPLLITLHGTHGKAQYMIKSSNAKELADKHQVIIASPQARTMSKGDWDNHYPKDVYWETHPSLNPATNPDLQLIQAVILAAQKAYNVDPRRIYVLGHSNGGFFSLLVAMALPNKIAAFVTNSSGLVRCATTGSCAFKGSGTSCAALAKQGGWCSCSGAEKPATVASSGRKVPGYLVHSSDDTTVSVYYTCSLATRMQSLGYTTSVNILTGNGHSMPYMLAVTAWAWLSKHKLP